MTELGLPYERQDYGGPFGGNRAADYLRLNPNGVVPTLRDSGTVVWESNTILRYLANKVAATSLYPVDAAARSHCERWMDWQLSTLNPSITPLYITLIRTPHVDRDMGRVAETGRQVRDHFQILDRWLTRNSFLAGNQFTLADIAVGIYAYRWYNLDVDRGLICRRCGDGMSVSRNGLRSRTTS
ncbi:glutathione S-transferase family protein [Sphingobium scionense]